MRRGREKSEGPEEESKRERERNKERQRETERDRVTRSVMKEKVGGKGAESSKKARTTFAKSGPWIQDPGC